MPAPDNISIGSRDSEMGTPIPNPDFFKAKTQPRAIRVLTVLAYILSVSMAAILLSIYYIFMWQGVPHVGARKGQHFNGVVERPFNFSYRYYSEEGSLNWWNKTKAEDIRVIDFEEVNSENGTEKGVEIIEKVTEYVDDKTTSNITQAIEIKEALSYVEGGNSTR